MTNTPSPTRSPWQADIDEMRQKLDATKPKGDNMMPEKPDTPVSDQTNMLDDLNKTHLDKANKRRDKSRREDELQQKRDEVKSENDKMMNHSKWQDLVDLGHKYTNKNPHNSVRQGDKVIRKENHHIQISRTRDDGLDVKHNIKRRAGWRPWDMFG